MSEFVTCSSCGARNGGEAVWCTMCFTPLRTPEPDLVKRPSNSESERTEAPMDSGPLFDEESEQPSPDGGLAEPLTATWTCRTCEAVNPMASDVCSVCGTTIFESMGAETDEVTLTHDQGLRLGLVPGWAHARLGEPLLGFLVAILVLACIGFAIVFIQSGAAVWGLVVGLVGLGTWVVSIFDVNQRIAGAAPVLRPRVMTILGGIVIVVIMVAGFVAGATAVRSPGS